MKPRALTFIKIGLQRVEQARRGAQDPCIEGSNRCRQRDVDQNEDAVIAKAIEKPADRARCRRMMLPSTRAIIPSRPSATSQPMDSSNPMHANGQRCQLEYESAARAPRDSPPTDTAFAEMPRERNHGSRERPKGCMIQRLVGSSILGSRDRSGARVVINSSRTGLRRRINPEGHLRTGNRQDCNGLVGETGLFEHCGGAKEP